MNHQRIEAILTWVGVALFFGLCWKFPAEAHWLLGAFGDHLTGAGNALSR